MISELTQEKESLLKLNESLRKETAELLLSKERASALAVDYSSLEKTIEARKVEVKAVEAKNAELALLLAKTISEVSEVLAKKKTAAEELTDVSKSLELAKKQLEEARSAKAEQVAVFQQIIESKKSEAQAAESACSTLSEMISAKHAALEELKALLADKQEAAAKFEGLQQELESISTSLDSVRKSVEVAKQARAEAVVAAAEIEAKAEAQKVALGKERVTWMNEETQRKAVIEEKETSLEKRERWVDEARQKLQKYKTELEDKFKVEFKDLVI